MSSHFDATDIDVDTFDVNQLGGNPADHAMKLIKHVGEGFGKAVTPMVPNMAS
jgi:hypothetical protein